MSNPILDHWLTLRPERRQQWLKHVVALGVEVQDAATLANILASGDFLTEWRQVTEPQQIIRCFAECYETFYEDAPQLARATLVTLLTFALKNPSQMPTRLIAITLQPRNNQTMLGHLAELVGEPETWLPDSVNRAVWDRFSRTWRRVRGGLARRAGRLDEACEVFAGLHAEWADSSFEAAEDASEMSSLLYEEAFANHLAGKSELAAILFDQSGDYAAKAGEPVSATIGHFRAALTRYLNRSLPPAEACGQFIQCFEQFQTQAVDNPMAADWCINVALHLVDVCVDLKDVDLARQWYERFSAQRRVEEESQQPLYRFHHANCQARLLMLENNRERDAAALFATFLDAPLEKFGEPEDELVEFVKTMHETARAYRDAGICLQRLGEAELARTVWSRGLTLKPQLGNQHYQHEITEWMEDLCSSPEDNDV
jgi:tetratricopeptide (TPR) repeat protein